MKMPSRLHSLVNSHRKQKVVSFSI